MHFASLRDLEFGFQDELGNPKNQGKSSLTSWLPERSYSSGIAQLALHLIQGPGSAQTPNCAFQEFSDLIGGERLAQVDAYEESGAAGSHMSQVGDGVVVSEPVVGQARSRQDQN